MRFSTKGRYALRLMIDLACHNDGSYIALKDISRRQGISIKYLEQIVTQLNRAGYVKSVRGPQGGYRLAKKPEDYTAGDILRITEGSLAPISCLETAENSCPRKQTCGTLPFWTGLSEVIDQYVDQYTLKDLAADQATAEGPEYCI